MTNPRQKPSASRRPSAERKRARKGASWDERCAVLFEDLRKPARVMIARAYGRSIGPDEIDDIYASAWTSTLAALRGRAERMDDDELRAYLLAAVANHASKEMRRRSRRPTSEFSSAHAEVLADTHAPSPEERAVGAEAGGVARDLLASLPKRRRAVMLLRYGWGLEPKQICGLVADLSPRAYRKEITKGVGDLIERLREVESGAWCESREPILRDYVAGTADEEGRRQAIEHLGHCRSCRELVGRLDGHLHDLGSTAAWTSLAGVVGEEKLSLPDRIGGVFDRGRELAGAGAERGEEAAGAATALAGSGGGRGAGAAGAGVLAKLAGFGAAGKVAIGCISAGAAATACLATGVIPAGKPGGDGERRAQTTTVEAVAVEDVSLAPTPNLEALGVVGDEESDGGGDAGGGGDGDGGGGSEDSGGEEQPEPEAVETAPEGAPLDSSAPLAPADQQEFGLPAAASQSASTGSSGNSSSSGTGGGSSSEGGSGGGSGGGASGGDVAKEFGP